MYYVEPTKNIKQSTFHDCYARSINGKTQRKTEDECKKKKNNKNFNESKRQKLQRKFGAANIIQIIQSFVTFLHRTRTFHIRLYCFVFITL